MELGVCDLHEFLKHVKWSLDVSEIVQIWRALVARVDGLHESDIIHRDIKPQNFILVPVGGHSDTRVLAGGFSSSPEGLKEDFSMRLVRPPDGNNGDVELSFPDPADPRSKIKILLSIKMTDFGIARPLANDANDKKASHLSVFGPNGTVVFMAPEAVRQTPTGCRKVSKRADVWRDGNGPIIAQFTSTQRNDILHVSIHT